jgi:CTD small phosphatase-like protein 2
VLFTASYKDYADAILKLIDPEDKIFDYKLYRENCIEYYNSYMVKDLRIIRNRNLKDMVLVDNSAISFLSQLSNGIPIIPYSDSKDDDELLDLTRYLLSIKDNYDLRIHNKKTF